MLKRFKGIVAGLICFVMCFMLTGCDVNTYIHQSTQSHLKLRADENIKYVEQLASSGIISKNSKEYEALINYFNSLSSFLTNITDKNEAEKALKNMKPMISHVYAEGFNTELGKYLVNQGIISSGSAGALTPNEPYGKKELDNINNSTNTLATLGNITIYKAKFNEVLNEGGIDVFGSMFNTLKKIDDDTGKSNDTKVSEKNNEVDRFFETTDNKLFNSDSIQLLKGTVANGGNNEFGKDIILYATGDKDENGKVGAVPVCAFRIYEINPEYVKKVLSVTSNSLNTSGRYYIVNNKALLLEYPVSYINKVYQEGDKFKLGTTVSNLLINIKNGNLYKQESLKEEDGVIKVSGSKGVTFQRNKIYMSNEKDVNLLLGNTADTEDSTVSETIKSNIDADGKETKQIVKTITTEDGGNVKVANYKMDDSKLFSENKSSNASFFMVNRDKNVQYIENIDGKEITFDVVAKEIVLKDYLEFVPTPGYSQSQYTPLGRRVRFRSDVIINGCTENDIIAMYIDNSGSNMFPASTDVSLTSVPLKVADFVNSDASKEIIKVLKLNANGEKVNSTATNSTFNAKVGLPGSEINYVQELYLAFPFNGSISIDNSFYESNKPLMYGVKVYKDMNETVLFNKWLTNSTETNGVEWWNSWLNENGFTFSVDLNELLNKAENGLYYEKVQEDNIILDINTIQKIQEDMDEENEKENALFISTLFVALGILIIFYGLLIPCCWLFDTNILMGPKLLSLISFGKMVAVPDKDELFVDSNRRGRNNDKEPDYMDLKDAIMKGIFFMAIGVVFTTFDMKMVLIAIIKNVLGVINWVWNLVFR